MAKKRLQPEKRTDAERRARQCERLSRHLRVLHCILGPGKWDADALARELEVSPRTIHRIMQTLSMANIPWYFCKVNECYRVRPGFKFPGLVASDCAPSLTNTNNVASLLFAAEQVLKDAEQFSRSVRDFAAVLQQEANRASGEQPVP